MLQTIGEISIFKRFNTEHKGFLYSLLEKKEYKADEFIIQEGDDDKNLYIIVQGSVRVLKKNDLNELIEMSILGPKEYFGEISLFDQKPRSAYIRAFEDTILMALSPVNFSQLCIKYPELEAYMLKAFLIDIASKLRSTSEQAINQSYFF